MTEEPDLKGIPEYGPHLGAAFFCEKVLQERDGSISPIRIIDRVTRTTLSDSPSTSMEPFNFNLSLVIILKTGENAGTTVVEVVPNKPNNEKLPPWKQTINMEPPNYKGANIVANLAITFDQHGPWWFDLRINGKLRTRIPLEVIYLPQVTQRSDQK